MIAMSISNAKSLSIWFILLVLFSLSGCASLSTAPELPTLMPDEYVPTAIALTAQAMITPTLPPPDFSPTPEVTSVIVPTEEATSTLEIVVTEQNVFAPAPTNVPIIPGAEIQFILPGPLSKVVQPVFDFVAYITPGADKNARVELWGEDGRLIFRKIYNFTTPNPQGRLVTDVIFETEGVAETAKLVIQTNDIHGRIQALASQELILLAEGDFDINTAGDYLAPIVIQEPQEMILIQGGTVSVSGLARPGSDEPLLVELIAADGRVIGNRLAGVVPVERGHSQFSVDVPYQVDSPTWVRVTVTERGGRLPGPVNISTVEVLLSP